MVKRAEPPSHVYVIVDRDGCERGTSEPGMVYRNGLRRVRYVLAPKKRRKARS
jgi:hypothetical protein